MFIKTSICGDIDYCDECKKCHVGPCLATKKEIDEAKSEAKSKETESDSDNKTNE